MTTGAPALTENGVRLSWADNTMHWAVPARKYIDSNNFLDLQLGFLTLHFVRRPRKPVDQRLLCRAVRHGGAPRLGTC